MTDTRHSYTVKLTDPDLDALLWQWRQDRAHNAAVPEFSEWLSNLLWEQAEAIREGIGAHTAWTTVSQRRASRDRRVTFHLYPSRN